MPIRKNPAISRASARHPGSAGRGHSSAGAKGRGVGTSRLKAEENRRLSAVGHPWRGCEERVQLPKLSPRELEKAAWFPELSSGPKAAAPGRPAQLRGSIAEPQNSPSAHLLESGCSKPPRAQGCAPRDGATRGHPSAPHPTGGPGPPGAAAALMDLALLAAVALAHAAPRGVCRSLAAAVVGPASARGSWGAGGGRKPGSALGLRGVSPPSAPGLSAGRGRSPGMR